MRAAILTFTHGAGSRRMTIAAIVLAAAIAAFTVGASATPVAVGGTHSESDIQGHCDKAGGVFFSSETGYSCVAAGGKVDCQRGSGKCTGDCKSCGGAAITHKGGAIFGILSGTTQKAGANAPAKTAAAPARRLPVADSVPIQTTIIERHRKK